MEALSLRPAVEEDVPFLLELRRQTMSAHQVASGVAPSDEERLRRVLTRFDCASVVLLGGRPVGLLKAVREGANWELVQIQLTPSLQGRGLGTRLLRRLVDEARRAGASLRLSVLKANPARRLYERLGFVVVGEDGHSFEMVLAQEKRDVAD